MKEIVESILEYVKTDSTDYAVMINGKWGSGKTYFWNNVLKKKIEEIKDYSVVYVSLYGVTSVEEINRKIFYQTYFSSINDNSEHPLNDTLRKKIPEIGKLVLGLTGIVTGRDIKKNLKGIDLNKFLSFENTVLCFDDLERVNFDIAEVLGYINNFVEHDGIKTIIIGNEREIYTRQFSKNAELKKMAATFFLKMSNKTDNEQELERDKKVSFVDSINESVEMLFSKSDDYKNIKEKLIGKTYTFKAENVLDSIVENVNSKSESHDFIMKKAMIISDLFLRSGIDNLRILKQGLEDFEKVYKVTRSKFPSLDEEITTSILTFCLIFSFELKSGNMNLYNINSNEEFQSKLLLEHIDENPSYTMELLIKYYRNYNLRSFTFFESVKELILNGVLRKGILEEEIIKQIEERNPKDYPGYLKIIRYGFEDLSDEEFVTAINETYKDLKEGNMKLRYYYLGYKVFSFMINENLIDRDKKTIKKIFTNGLKEAAKKQTYDEDLEVSFLSHQVDDDDSAEIKELVIRTNAKMREKEDKKYAKKLMSLMIENMDAFYSEIEESYTNRPFFIHLDAKRIVDTLVNAENKDINLFLQAIRSIYKKSETEYLEADISKLQEIAELINQSCEELDRGKNRLKIWNLRRVVKFINEY